MDKVLDKIFKYGCVAFDIQIVVIMTIIFYILGQDVWFLPVKEAYKAIFEFVLFCGEVIIISICIYNIKNAKRNNWK